MAEDEKQEAAAGDGEGSRFIHEERAHRLAKLDAMRERGVEPYPVRFDRDHTAAELHERFADLGPGADSGERVSVAGRVVALRRHGGLDFADLRDETAKIQLIATRDQLGEGVIDELNALDLGDWIGADGHRRDQQTRRAVGPDRELRAALQGPAAAARHAPRPHRPRGPLPAPLPRPDRRRGLARGLREALDRDRGDPPGAARPRLPRGRDAGPALARPAAPRRGRSSPTTTRSTSTCSCGSPWSCR